MIASIDNVYGDVRGNDGNDLLIGETGAIINLVDDVTTYVLVSVQCEEGETSMTVK